MGISTDLIFFFKYAINDMRNSQAAFPEVQRILRQHKTTLVLLLLAKLQ